MSRAYGDPEIAARLRKARVIAGFHSARNAALQQGWPPGTYLGHETGTRRIAAEALARYASAFEAPLEWLQTGEAPRTRRHALFARVGYMPIEMLMAEFLNGEREAVPEDSAKATARRLTLARIVAGFATASAAVAHFGIRRTTYLSYEGARARISTPMSSIYGQALGVDGAWLRAGLGSSGSPTLDGLSEEEIAETLSSGQAPRVAEASTLGDPNTISSLDALEAARLGTRSQDPKCAIRLPEWKDGPAAPRLTDWTIPVDAVAHVPERRRDGLVVVTISSIIGVPTRVQSGDRVVVDLGSDDGPPVCVEGAKFIIAADRPRAKVIGSVVMLLAAA